MERKGTERRQPLADLKEIKEFLTRYSNFRFQGLDREVRDFQMAFGYLRSAMETFKELKRKYDRQVAPCFNIFEILDVQRLEVQTHSRFLAELLDPDGSHGQGNYFLSSFLESIIAFPKQPIRSGHWEVETEKSTHQGNLDIVISNYQDRYIVVIENKIYAGNQPDQLERYHNWLINHSHFSHANRRRLVYLTLDGREYQSQTSPPVPHLRVSHKTQIAKWLTDVVKGVPASPVRLIIRQYLATIDAL